MTLVNTETGELLDAAAAERRAERIRLRLDTIADNYAAVLPMIREAMEARDDLALGYRSATEYVADRFGGALTQLGVDVRREVVRELTQAGMSTRAIARVIDVSNKTVHQDQRASRVTEVTPHAPEGGATADTGALTSASVESAPPPRPPVIGIDGKSYSRRPAPDPTPAAVAEFPDLAYYADLGDSQNVALLAEDLRRYRERGELDERLDNLRRSIALERAKRDGTYRPGTTAVMDPDGTYRMRPLPEPAAPAPSVCPACGQTVRN